MRAARPSPSWFRLPDGPGQGGDLTFVRLVGGNRPDARLYSAQQQLAEGLQRGLLTEPPEPDDVVRLRRLLRRAGLHVEHDGGTRLTLVVPAPDIVR